MSSKRFTTLLLSLVLLVSLAACGGGNSTRTGDDPNTIYMGNSVFNTTATTIARDSSITLIADTFTPHFIANGTWQGDKAVQEREDGAPEADNIHIEGNKSASIGPFSTAGTFDFYCTIHPGMNLTVTVE